MDSLPCGDGGYTRIPVVRSVRGRELKPCRHHGDPTICLMGISLGPKQRSTCHPHCHIIPAAYRHRLCSNQHERNYLESEEPRLGSLSERLMNHLYTTGH